MDHEAAGIPKRFWGATLDDYDVKHEPKLTAVLTKAKNAAHTYIKQGYSAEAKGLLFVGPPGVGKTMLACIVALAVGESGSTFYIPMAAYLKYLLGLNELRSAWEKMEDEDAFNQWKALDDRVRRILNDYKLLVVDDVGKERHTGSGFAQDEFDFLIRRRFDLGLATIMTSNVPIPQWDTKYSSSMQSFIHEAFTIVEFNVPADYDYRSV